MRPGTFLFWLLLVAIQAIQPAAAHKPSDAYLALSVQDGTVTGQWDIALRDLEHAIGLDADQDGRITWGELRRRQDAIAAYALGRLQVAAGHEPCRLRPGEQLVDQHSDGTYAVLRFAAACPASVQELGITYRLFAELDPLHRGLLRVTDGALTHAAVLGPQTPGFSFGHGRAPDRWGQAVAYGLEGVHHILSGYDHLLFLLTLLLPAVLRRSDGRWRPVPRLRDAARETVAIVTAFTVAHSITLTLAALGMVGLPSRLVESVIALTIVLAALNNLRPVVTRRLWLVAFGFGLIHGLGFASALQELGLPPDALLLSLLSFNLGVEIGQLAVVALFLPLAFVGSTTALYPRLALQAGSAAIGAVAFAWLLERAFDLSLLA
jgi:hypothetical protein